MKKTLLTVAMCAASLIGTAWAGFNVEKGEYATIVTGTGSYNEFIQALEDFGQGYEEGQVPFIQLGDKVKGESANVTFSEGDEYTPMAVTLYFALTTLEFKDILTLKPDPRSYAGPGMVAGYIVGYEDDGAIIDPGSLTISISKSKVDAWLDSQASLDDMASWHLLDNSAEIRPTAEASVTMQFIGENGEVVVKEGDVYQYTDKDQKSHTYENVGVVWAAGELQKHQIALHFVPGAEGEWWGGGQLNVLALGENYVPVPEPTTGSLSLLALAGLCARRRRK